MATFSRPFREYFKPQSAGGNVDRAGVGVSHTGLSDESGISKFGSPEASKGFKNTIEFKTHSVIGGYHAVTRGNKKKARVGNQMLPGHRRENDSEIDYHDTYSKATWDLEFSCARSSMVKRIQYDSKRLWMRVEFVNRDDIVIYDHVPADSYYFLKHCCDISDGHVGKEFWDVVRYRGQLLDSKYPFWYESKGTVADDARWAGASPEVRELNRLMVASHKGDQVSQEKIAKLQEGIQRYDKDQGYVITNETQKAIDALDADDEDPAKHKKMYHDALTERMEQRHDDMINNTQLNLGTEEFPIMVKNKYGARGIRSHGAQLWKRQQDVQDAFDEETGHEFIKTTESIMLPKNFGGKGKADFYKKGVSGMGADYIEIKDGKGVLKDGVSKRAQEKRT